MRSNNPVNMDIDQLRGWASLMDRAMIASLVVTLLAVAALGITTFLSFRYSAAVRAHEQTALDRYKGLESEAAQREREATAAREQAAALERAIATERDRAARLEREVSLARDQATALAREAEHARQQAMALEKAALEKAALEQAAREAADRATQAPVANKAPAETARPPMFDAAEIRRRLADLGKLVKDAATRAPEPTRETPADVAPPTLAAPAPPPSPFVASLQRFAGTPAAIFLLGQISDAPAIGATISADLGQAGWAPQTWTWGGVAGIYGVVVLVRDGSDPAMHEAAAALVDALGAAGFNASKGDWPANWGRFRGTLNGPQTPAPTDAAIRIVVGEKARKAP